MPEDTRLQIYKDRMAQSNKPLLNTNESPYKSKLLLNNEAKSEISTIKH